MTQAAALGTIVLLTAILGALPAVPAAPDPGWNLPFPISGVSGETRDPVVAIDPYGTGFIAWGEKLDDGLFHVFAARYSAQGWGVPAPLETSVSGNSSDIRVAAGGDGSGLVVWSQRESGYKSIFAARYDPAGGWGRPFLLESQDAGVAQLPRAAIAADGTAVVVWQQRDGVEENIYASRSIAGGGFDTPRQIDSATGIATDLEVSMDDDGNAFATWEQGPSGGTRDVWVSRFAPGSGWQTVRAESRGEDAKNPDVAADAGGAAVVTWIQNSGSIEETWASVYTVSGGWSTPTALGEAVGNVESPRAGMGGGTAVVTWVESGNDIWAGRYRLGLWGTAQLLDGGDGAASGPQVSVDAVGNAVVVWQQDDGPRDSVFTARSGPAGAWGVGWPLEGFELDGSTDPQVAFAAGGNGMAVWTENQLGRSWVFMARYIAADSDGDGLGDSLETASGTNAANADTDGDGLSDSQELWGLGLDPTDPDMDDDGLSDGTEVYDTGTDPRVADAPGTTGPTPVQSVDLFTLLTLLFLIVVIAMQLLMWSEIGRLRRLGKKKALPKPVEPKEPSPAPAEAGDAADKTGK